MDGGDGGTQWVLFNATEVHTFMIIIIMVGSKVYFRCWEWG